MCRFQLGVGPFAGGIVAGRAVGGLLRGGLVFAPGRECARAHLVRGWGESLIGVHTTLPIPAYIPMLVFAIVFGLSMDYEVFLLSRVHEAWIETGDPHRAVAVGIGATSGSSPPRRRSWWWSSRASSCPPTPR